MSIVLEVLAELAAWPPFAAGWIAGVLVRFLSWTWEAATVGYADGRQEEAPWQEP